MKTIVKFFDYVEDKLRSLLSRHPILYGLIGGIGIVLFWRGVWHTADEFAFLTGPVSFIIGAVLLLLIGVFVSVFIGDQIIISGLKHEEKEIDKELGKAETEIHSEKDMLREIDAHLENIQTQLKKKKRTTK